MKRDICLLPYVLSGLGSTRSLSRSEMLCRFCKLYLMCADYQALIIEIAQTVNINKNALLLSLGTCDYMHTTW